eukprot:1000351-Pelagomonas_calceolata.AAC.3
MVLLTAEIPWPFGMDYFDDVKHGHLARLAWYLGTWQSVYSLAYGTPPLLPVHSIADSSSEA